MKKYFFLFVGIFLISTLSAQKKTYKDEIHELFWGADDEYGSIADYPEKWSGESGVVLYQKLLYKYEAKSSKTYAHEGFRRRIVLLDQAAVDDYSELTIENPFDEKLSRKKQKGTTVVEIRIQKPDGTVKDVDFDEAVEIEGEQKEKIAVPDLEIGDILDYYLYERNENTYINVHEFSPVVSRLSSSYPKVIQEVLIECDEDTRLSLNSYNGAPEFKELDTENKKFRTYQLIDEDRDNVDRPRWYFSYRNEPYYKFQCVATSSSGVDESKMDLNFLAEQGARITSFEEDDIIRRFQAKERKVNYKKIAKLRKKDFARITSSEDFVREEWENNLKTRVIEYIEPIILSQERIKTSFYGVYFSGFPDDLDMVFSMSNTLKAAGIDCQLVAALNRDFSPAQDFLLFDEIDFILKVNINNEAIYLPQWSVFGKVGEIPRGLEGAESFVFDFGEKGELINGKKEILPIRSADDNLSKRTVTVDLSDLDQDNYNVRKFTELHGHAMDYYQDELLTTKEFLDYMSEYYDEEWYVDGLNGYVDSDKEVIRKYEEYCDEQLENAKERAEEMIRKDYDFKIKEYESLDIQSCGVLDQDKFIMEEKFTIDKSGFLKKAGPNFLLPVGNFIDSQVAVKEDEMDRTEDIHMTFARAFEYDITINLPEGYTVEGIEDLNTDVQNSTGGFKSEASLDGQILKISSKKWYSHNYEPGEKWPEMIEFLEAAYQFSQLKVLLKKV